MAPSRCCGRRAGWARLHKVLLDRLEAGAAFAGTAPRWTAALFPQKGELADRAEPDRGKPGTKHSVLTETEGAPLGLTLGPANQHDSKPTEATLDAVPPVSGGRRGRPRRRPKKLHAYTASRGRSVRQTLRKRAITPRIARPGMDSSKHLGCHRWVIGRTLARMVRFRRLTVGYERRADIHLAFVTLAAALI